MQELEATKRNCQHSISRRYLAYPLLRREEADDYTVTIVRDEDRTGLLLRPFVAVPVNLTGA